MSDALSRKRPSSSTEAGPSQVKKRALVSPNGLPGRNNDSGHDEAEDQEPRDESLENFRKEAIFRRMRQHEREKKRALERVDELEQRKRELEGSIGAIENCWNQVLNQLHLLAKLDPLNLPTPSHVPDLLKLVALHGDGSSIPSAAFRRALVDDGVKTQALVEAFTAMTPPRPTREYADLLNRCQATTSEATSLRAELHVNHAALVDAQTELETLRDSLTLAENKLHRIQQEAAQNVERRAGEVAKEIASRSSAVKSEPNESRHPSEGPKMNGTNGEHASDDVEELRASLFKKEAECAQLSFDKARLRSIINALNAQITSSSEETVQKHPAFTALVEVVSSLKLQLAEAVDQASKAEANAIHNLGQLELARAQEISQLASELESYKEKYEERSKEVIKVKDQRDGANREIAIFKAKESSKLQDHESAMLRTRSLEERVEGLVLEVKRLKARLAAEAGQADLLSVLLSDDKGDVSFVDDLREKLRSAELKVTALENTLASLDSSNPDIASHVRSEATAKEELILLRAEVERYKKTFGPQLSSESADLVARLKESEKEVERLQLVQRQESASSNDLFDELQRMSSAWEILEKQSKAKADDLTAWEAKCSRLTVEKAKAEQKYFGTMREREALEAEKKAANRTIQQQNLLITKLTETQDQMSERAKLWSEMSSASDGRVKDAERRLAELEQEVVRVRVLEAQYKQEATLFKASMENAETETERVRLQVKSQDEELAKLRKVAHVAASRVSTKPGESASKREEQLQSEVSQLMSILRCSTCKHELRTHVLVKCLHTFCKSCLDARLTTRQRRCPACDIKFQDSDVQALFFQ